MPLKQAVINIKVTKCVKGVDPGDEPTKNDPPSSSEMFLPLSAHRFGFAGCKLYVDIVESQIFHSWCRPKQS